METEKKLAEKLGFRVDENGQAWTVKGINPLATTGPASAALWRECLNLMAEQEWVKVSDERKPPMRGDDEYISVDVLLYVPEWERRGQRGVVVGHYLKHSNKFRPEGSNGWEDAVTHWRPLPDAPGRPITLPEQEEK